MGAIAAIQTKLIYGKTKAIWRNVERGKALKRTCRVFNIESEVCIQYGVPQGQIVDPLLFHLYMLPLGSIAQQYISYQSYADDTVTSMFLPTALAQWMTSTNALLLSNIGLPETHLQYLQTRLFTILEKHLNLDASCRIHSQTVFAGLTKQAINKLQHMEFHITQTSLHWLPEKQRIDFTSYCF